jgi:hypothetical protein
VSPVQRTERGAGGGTSEKPWSSLNHSKLSVSVYAVIFVGVMMKVEQEFLEKTALFCCRSKRRKTKKEDKEGWMWRGGGVGGAGGYADTNGGKRCCFL